MGVVIVPPHFVDMIRGVEVEWRRLSGVDWSWVDESRIDAEVAPQKGLGTCSLSFFQGQFCNYSEFNEKRLEGLEISSQEV